MRRSWGISESTSSYAKMPANAFSCRQSNPGVLETGAFADIPHSLSQAPGVPSIAEQCTAEIQRQESLKLGPRRDPLYLFACYLEWRNEGNLRAFQELLAGLDDPNEDARIVAESLLGRPSPRRRQADGNRDHTDLVTRTPSRTFVAAVASPTVREPRDCSYSCVND
jgi:hypothetical protein